MIRALMRFIRGSLGPGASSLHSQRGGFLDYARFIAPRASYNRRRHAAGKRRAIRDARRKR